MKVFPVILTVLNCIQGQQQFLHPKHQLFSNDHKYKVVDEAPKKLLHPKHQLFSNDQKYKKLDRQIQKIELLQPRKAHRPANLARESLIKKSARVRLKSAAALRSSNFINSDNTIRSKIDNSICLGAVEKSKKGPIVTYGNCDSLNNTQWTYNSWTGAIRNVNLYLCIAVHLSGKSWRQVALLKPCDPFDSRQSWNYESETKNLVLRISNNACLGINSTADSGPVVSFDCMQNEVELPSGNNHEFKIGGKCAKKQGNWKRAIKSCNAKHIDLENKNLSNTFCITGYQAKKYGWKTAIHSQLHLQVANITRKSICFISDSCGSSRDKPQNKYSNKLI